jgi:type I restriction enzyme, S subunit
MQLKVDSGQLPVGWKVKKLGEVCDIKPPKEEARQKLSDADLVSFVPMSDLGIQSKTITLNDNKLLSEVIGSYTYFADNDVLLAKITPCFENGKLGIAQNLTNGVGFGSSEYIVFRSKGTIEPEYLFYFLSQDSFRNSGAHVMTGAVGHKRVPKDFIENYPILLPQIPEQKRVVAILDEAFEGIDKAIANAENNLANAHELFESYLQNLDAEKEPLGNLVDIKTGKLDANAATENGQYPFFTCSRDIYKIDSFAFDCEAILLAGNNAVGDFNVKHYKGRFNAYQRTYVITINKENRIFYRYLYFQILKSLKKFKLQSVGAGTKFLKMGMIQGLQIALPTIEKQQEIIFMLDKLESETQRLEAIYRKKITALNELKQSILQKAFTGELTAATVEKAA